MSKDPVAGTPNAGLVLFYKNQAASMNTLFFHSSTLLTAKELMRDEGQARCMQVEAANFPPAYFISLPHPWERLSNWTPYTAPPPHKAFLKQSPWTNPQLEPMIASSFEAALDTLCKKKVLQAYKVSSDALVWCMK